jgi:hypothetical protein
MDGENKSGSRRGPKPEAGEQKPLIRTNLRDDREGIQLGQNGQHLKGLRRCAICEVKKILAGRGSKPLQFGRSNSGPVTRGVMHVQTGS